MDGRGGLASKWGVGGWDESLPLRYPISQLSTVVHDQLETFRPYAMPDEAWLTEALRILTSRGEKSPAES